MRAPSFTEAAARAARTIEELLDTPGALKQETVAALLERYFW
jgi:hypothetical protein